MNKSKTILASTVAFLVRISFSYQRACSVQELSSCPQWNQVQPPGSLSHFAALPNVYVSGDKTALQMNWTVQCSGQFNGDASNLQRFLLSST